MDDDGSSFVDPPPESESSRGVDIPPENRETIVRLYQKNPKLWAAFRDIVNVVDLLATKTQADEVLLRALERVNNRFNADSEDAQDFVLFAAVSGFVERSVSFSRQLLRDMGKSYLTEFSCLVEKKFVGFESPCLLHIRCQLLNYTYTSSEFSLRLTKTGFLQDLLEDVKHIQHLSVEALERGEVFLSSLGTIHNCCMYLESGAVVKQMDIVPHITPFLAKRGPNHLIHAVAMAVIAHVATEDQLELMELDTELLRYYLNNVQVAQSTEKTNNSNWGTREILVDLNLLARNSFNKRLMVAQGILQILQSVLEPPKKRPELEKQNAVAIITRLIEDQINLHICQNYQELVEVLKGLQLTGANADTVEKVHDILGKLEEGRRERDDCVREFPKLSDLLADHCNVLSILDIGFAEFVLDHLKTCIAEQVNTPAHRDVSCKRVLVVLTELAVDEAYRREIMSRGGLDMVKTVLQKGSTEEKTAAAKVLLELAMGQENRPIIKLNAELTELLEDLKRRAEHQELGQLAGTVLLELSQ